jgi:hypothetical protein
MKTNINNLDNSEKNRILEMHINNGYKTILESPMDSMFYQGDDYVKDAGQSLQNVLEELKTKLSSKFSAVVSEIPNPELLISSANKFFGGDVSSMSTEEVENKIKEKLKESGLHEGFWSDFINKDYRGEKEEYIETPLKDVEGGIVQKMGSLLMKIFGVNILSFGMIGSILANVLGSLHVSPPMSMIISIIAFVVVNILRRLSAFTKERYFD